MIEDIQNDSSIENIILGYLQTPVDILQLSTNTFGCYVIKKLIECVNEDRRLPLNFVIISNFEKLAMDMHGILIIKPFLQKCKDNINKEQIVNIISKDFFNLCQNQFSNFIIQDILEVKDFIFILIV